MKTRNFLLPLLLFLMTSCAPAGSDRVPVAELPDPAIYALSVTELPEVGASWQQSYNQTTAEEGYKWSYLAYQAYQPGSVEGELDYAYAVNNDVILYEVDMSREDLPQPPQALGNIQGVSWKSVSQTHKLGYKSGVWKTSIGELLTPVWWLEFYQGHAYVRISLFGFPDQIAPPFIYGLADIVASRLPRSVETLRTDAATVIATLPALGLTAPPPVPAVLSTQPVSSTLPDVSSTANLPVLSYIAPPGETGMVSYFDDSGNQMTDGILGADDILTDLGSGTAHEWVGWTDLTEPVTLTFSLQADESIAAVKIGLNHREGLGIFVPSRVTINGVSFEPTAEAVPNNQRADVTITGPFNGPIVTIVLNHRGRGWILVDEVRFIP